MKPLRFISDNHQDTNPYPLDLRRIAAALIENAIWFAKGKGLTDGQKTMATKQKHIKDAVDWLARRDCRTIIFTFEWCCEICQKDPDQMRAKIEKLELDKRYRFRSAS